MHKLKKDFPFWSKWPKEKKSNQTLCSTWVTLLKKSQRSQIFKRIAFFAKAGKTKLFYLLFNTISSKFWELSILSPQVSCFLLFLDRWWAAQTIQEPSLFYSIYLENLLSMAWKCSSHVIQRHAPLWSK